MLHLASAWLVVILGANPYLAQGRASYRQLDYERAEASLRLAQKVSGNAVQERREIDDLLARTLVAQGRLEEAEDVYRTLLAEDAAAPAPVDAAPKIQRLFLHAKHRVYPPHFVALTLRPSAPQTVGVGITDPWSEVRAVECEGRALSIDNGEARGACAPGSRVTALDGQRQQLAQRVVPSDAPSVAVVSQPAEPAREAQPAPRAAALISPALVVQQAAPPSRPRRGLFQRPGTYLALGAIVLGAAAAGLALSAHGAQGSLADPRSAAEAQSGYQRIAGETVTSWVLGGAAVAAAGTGVVLFTFGS